LYRDIASTFPNKISALLRLVHVSDIHFRHGPGWDLDADQRDQLIVDLASLVDADGQAVDGIVVGGDIAFSGDSSQYEDAREWLGRLMAASSCPAGGVWVVPGNHDVEWPIIENSKILKDFRDEVRGVAVEKVDPLLNERMAIDAAGTVLLEPLREYNHFAGEWGCQTAAVELEWYDPLGSLEGMPVRLCGLNSAFISDQNDARDDEDPNLVLGSQQCKVKEEHGEIRIVLCHHPPTRLRDWSRVDPYLRRAHLLLFGHDHDFRCEQQGPRGQAWIHAGAVVPEQGSHRLATYNLLRLELDSEDLILRIESRIWSDQHKRFVAAVQDPEPIAIARDLRSLGDMKMEEPAEKEMEEPDQPIAATPLAPKDEGQPALSVNEHARLRQIAVAFMSAPATTRLDIAKQLGVLEDADLEMPADRERYGTILRRIRDEGKVDQLAEELGI
jgi:predicted MPP superfamily phosphohydrolase